jgi:hypothetical protein
VIETIGCIHRCVAAKSPLRGDSPDYRERYADNLGKDPPRIPSAKMAFDFGTDDGGFCAESNIYSKP